MRNIGWQTNAQPGGRTQCPTNSWSSTQHPFTPISSHLEWQNQLHIMIPTIALLVCGYMTHGSCLWASCNHRIEWHMTICLYLCCASSCSPVLVTRQCRDVHTVSSGEPPLLYSPLSALSEDTCGTEGESGEGHRWTRSQRVCHHQTWKMVTLPDFKLPSLCINAYTFTNLS